MNCPKCNGAMFFDKALDIYEKDEWCCHICGKRLSAVSKTVDKEKQEEIMSKEKALAEINTSQIVYNGATRTLTEWANELGFSRDVLLFRLKYRKPPMTVEEAFTIPARQKNQEKSPAMSARGGPPVIAKNVKPDLSTISKKPLVLVPLAMDPRVKTESTNGNSDPLAKDVLNIARELAGHHSDDLGDLGLKARYLILLTDK